MSCSGLKEAAISNKTGGDQGLRRAGAVGIAAALAVLAAGCTGSSAPPPVGSRAAAPNGSPALANCLTASRCLAPSQLRAAYAIQPLLEAGIDGRSQSVVLPELAVTASASVPKVTDIRQDLADFDSRFGLPAAQIQVIETPTGSAASPWLAGVEEVVDTEMVHAVAPAAAIRVLLENPADVRTPAQIAAGYGAFVQTAAGQGDIISLSGGYGEHFFTSAQTASINAALEYAAAQHITFVASSGDGGVISDLGRFGSSTPVQEVSLPASDPLVLAVGATSLTANPVTGAYLGETALNTARYASASR